jgi:hypothetical protein
MEYKMSLVAFKRNSVIRYGANASGKPPGGVWLPQGPFGRPNTTNSVMLKQNATNPGKVGFSLEGAYRSIPVGKTMLFSQQGTPFRGQYPRGNGGTYGKYPYSQPVLNSNIVITRGTEWEYIKPSVLSTRGMLRKRFKWAYNGQYPNYIVKPDYGSSNLSQNTSSGLYTHIKSAQCDCVVNTNDKTKYENYHVNGGPTGCDTTGVRLKMASQLSNAGYTKELYQPQPSSFHTLRIQRQCADPTPAQKPYPPATNGRTCGATNVFVGHAP